MVKYLWTRDEHSLAAGVIVADTDKEPVMIVSKDLTLIPLRLILFIQFSS